MEGKLDIDKEYIENWPDDTCFVCHRKNISDQHHIIPVEYGGPKSGLTVPLCPTDHRNVHREAESIFKSGEPGNYINQKSYPDVGQRNRANFLAHYVLRAKGRFTASGKTKADDARNMAQVSFSNQELAIAHALKKQLGFRSLERMIKFLILDKYKSKNIK